MMMRLRRAWCIAWFHDPDFAADPVNLRCKRCGARWTGGRWRT